MQLKIDGRSFDTEEFVLRLEKIGICGLELSVNSEARAKMLNCLTDELKGQLLNAYSTIPNGNDYLRAYDLLMMVLGQLKEKYEHEENTPSFIIDSRQMALFRRARSAA